MNSTSEHLIAFHREANAIREVVDAKFDGINRVLTQMGDAISKLGETVERQSEQNVQLAVLTNTVAHIQATFIDHRMRADERADLIESRMSELESTVSDVKEKASVSSAKLNMAKVAVTGTIAGAVGFVTANLDTILKFAGIG